MTRLRQAARRAVLAIVIIAALPVVIIVGLPVLIFFETRAALALRAFRRRQAGRFYLVCSPRRGWHDFLRNNVIPGLPNDVEVIWPRPRRGGRRDQDAHELLGHLARSRIFDVARPYLVAVTPRSLTARSLNEDLQALKAHPKKSAEIRQAGAAIITAAQRDFQMI